MIAEIIILMALVALDQLSKYWTIMVLAPKGESISLLPGILELTYVENYGAAFGILQNNRFFLIGIVFIVFFMIIYFKIRLPRTKFYRPLHLLAIFIFYFL